MGAGRVVSAWREMVHAIREDHAMLRRYDVKYASPAGEGGPKTLAGDLVSRIGFQLMAACRAMRFCADAGIPLAPRAASRVIRHLYGSDIHWNARFSPGVMIVHGMGLCIAGDAQIESGVILFQHVTLGMGVEPGTRRGGAPTIERDAQIGAGSTVVGPVTVGARSKVTANCFVRSSVPPDSLVEAGPPTISTRTKDGRTARS